jgi:hypothetical protein
MSLRPMVHLVLAVSPFGLSRKIRPLHPPSLLRHVLRVSYRKVRCAAVYLFGLRPLHLCGTRLEGGHRRLFPSLRFVWVEPTMQRRFGCWLAGIAIAKRSTPELPSRSSARGSAGATKTLAAPGMTYLHDRRNGRLRRQRPRPTALRPADRIVVRDLGVHPRGEFRTSGAAVGQLDTWAA